MKRPAHGRAGQKGVFMKKITAWLLLELALLAACLPGMAEDEGVVSQTSCSIVQSGDYYLVYCFAQVHNASDQVICMDRGTLSLVSGEQLLATSDVSQIWPYFLSPGEDGYLFDIVAFEPNEDGVVIPSVTGISYDINYLTIPQEHASYGLNASARIETGAGDEMTVVCEVSNPTQTDAYDPTISFGLYTESGAMIYADGVTLQNVGIPAGERMLVRFPVDSVFVRQWTTYNASPSEARVKAVFRLNED